MLTNSVVSSSHICYESVDGNSHVCYGSVDDNSHKSNLQITEALEIQSMPTSFLESLISQLQALWNDTKGSLTRDFVMKNFYTFSWVIGRLGKVSDWSDVVAILDYVTRVHFDKPFCTYVFESLFSLCGIEAQSLDWSTLRDVVTKYEALKTHPVVVKFMKVVAIAFSGGILATLGLESQCKSIWELVTNAMVHIAGHTDFIAATLELFRYIGERVCAFSTTGNWRDLIHTPTNYTKWVDKSYDVLDASCALSNPEAVGMDYHKFLNDLAEVLEEGKSIKEYLRSADEKEAVSQLLSRLRQLQTDILIKNACGKMRMAPFAMMIYAGTSVGKTSFTDLCFSHFAKVYDKPEGDEYIYVRTPQEAHWNNFKSKMWGCLLDDVATLNPNKATSDPSSIDIIQAANFNSFSPPQAAIEDKGRTPFLCDILLATTNTEDLKAHCWYNNPQAIRRRLPKIVCITPKEEYRIPGTEMLDSSKVPPAIDGFYPDLWDIKVKQVLVSADQKVMTEIILETSDIYEFITQYNIWMAEHRRTQIAFMNTRETNKNVKICKVHLLPLKVCKCEPVVNLEAQVGEDVCDTHVTPQTPQVATTVVKTAVGAAGIFAGYKMGKFATNTVREEIIKDPSLIYSPVGLARATAQAIHHKCTDKKVEIIGGVKTYCRETLKSLLREGLYSVYIASVPALKRLLISMGILAGMGLTYAYLSKEFPELSRMSPQVDIDAVGVAPVVSNEKENVWRKNDYEPSRFIGRLSHSWADLGLTKVSSIIARNVVWCRTTHKETKHSIFRAVCVVGHLYVVPLHVLPSDEYFMLQVIHENNSEGCNGNISFKMAQACIYKRPELELAFFEINHMPLRRNLMDVLPKLKGFKCDAPGRIVVRMANGSIEYIDSRRSNVEPNQNIEQFNIVSDVIASRVSRDTVNGECGSPVIVTMPSGSILAGLHVLGGQRGIAIAMPLTQDVAQDAIDHFVSSTVEAKIPQLEGQNFSTEISPRCTARFVDKGVVQVYGSFNAFKRQPKSTACDTLVTHLLLEKGYVRKFGPAPMKGYTALHIGLKEIVQKPFIFKEDILLACVDGFVDDVWRLLPEKYRNELQHPLPLEVALNGMPGCKFIDSMNFSTSAGFPYNKSKRDFITRLPAYGVWQHPVTVNDTIKKEIAACWECMSLGISSSPVFMQHLKDEALPLKKVVAGKARIFMGGPFAWSVCVRMLLLPFVRVMQWNKYLFECAPGTNTTSIEWTRIYQYVTQHGTDRMVAGDFKSFDKSMGPLVIKLAFKMIYRWHQKAGAGESALKAINVVAEDVAFAFVNFNGDLMQFFGSNPSGHPLTVIINCLVNSLYMRYCYHELNPKKEVRSFKNNVALITYGDDNVLGSKVDWFNHTTIASVLSGVGIQYTMADKDSASVPFISIAEVSFLKRTFLWNDELKSYMGTLDEESIWKSLMIWVPSATDCPQKQMIDIIRAANSEFFLYGRERFEKETVFLKQLVMEAGLTPYVDKSVFLTWDQLADRYIASSHEYLASEPLTTRRLIGFFQWEIPLPSSMESTGLEKQNGLLTSSPRSQKMSHSTSYCCLPIKHVDHGERESGVECCTYQSVPQNTYLGMIPVGDQISICYSLPYGCKVGRNEAPTNQHERVLDVLPTEHQQQLCYGLCVQMDELDDGSTQQQRQENLVFADAGMASTHTTSMVTFKPDCDTSTGLGDYLMRPVAIDTFSWAEGSTTVIQEQFQPWSLFFGKPAIKRKLENYARLRAKLHLKFVVNASPFYYGALRVAYCPVDSTYRDIWESNGDAIKFSQMPGDFIYPQDMTSFEMELPFLTPYSWLDIGNLAEFEEMGRITYYLYSPLRSANGITSSNATITCYAWATDVELAGLTSGLALQVDEYDTAGVISGPATAVAKVASKLRDAPYVGPLARATEVGAKLVGGIASLFGYSNPPVIDDVHAYVPKSFHAFANVETSMPIDKLSIDPKNEITIDRTVTGANSEDELVISHFSGRDSYILQTEWTEAMGPGDQLFRFPVTPRNYASNAGVSQSFVNATPASHVAAMFTQWRGGMVYTMRFVKSRYHTGRVQISWDPETVPLDNAETTTVTRIVDLQTETEISFAVPYKSANPWLRTDNAANNWTNSPTGAVTYDASSHNGIVRVTVLNELTGPGSAQKVNILLFARAAHDIEFSVPNDLPYLSFLTVQSEESEDQLVDNADMAIPTTVNAVTVGETIASLRTLLHRTSLFHRGLLGNPNASNGLFESFGLFTLVNYVPRFPVEYGFTSLGTNYATGLLTPTKKQFQFSPNTPLGWVSNCFAGYRGAIVHHYNVIANGKSLIDELRVERDPRSWILDSAPRQALNRFSTRTTTAQPSTLSRVPTTTTFGVRRDITGQRGMSMTNTNTQSSLSVVTPQYSKWKFRPAYAKVRDFVNGVSEVESMKVVASVRCGMSSPTTDDGWPVLTTYVAGGVDFDPIFFICVPTMYQFATPAADDTF